MPANPRPGPIAALLTVCVLLATALAPPGDASGAADGPAPVPSVALHGPVASPSADACVPLALPVSRCVNLPLVVDDTGDHMTGDLAFSAFKGIAFQGGKLTADPALAFGSKAVCVAPGAPDGCGDISGVGAGFGLLGGGDAGEVALRVDPGLVQRRVAGECGEGFVQRIAEDGGVACGEAVAKVAAGEGLLAESDGAPLPGGAITIAGTLRLATPAAAALGGVHAGSCREGMVVVGIDTEGNVVCEWPGAAGLRTVRRATTAAAPVEVPEGQSLHGMAMAIGLDGLPRLAYVVKAAGSMELRVASCTTPECEVAAVATLDQLACTTCVVGPLDMAVSPTDLDAAVSPVDVPLVAYAWGDGAALHVKLARCATPDCGEGTVAAVLDKLDGVVSPSDVRPSLALGLDGTALVAYAYQDAKQVRHLRGAACTGLDANGCGPGSGAIDLYQTGGSNGLSSPALAVGLDGNPVLVYYEWESTGVALRVLHCGSPDCFAVAEAVSPVDLDAYMPVEGSIAPWAGKPSLVLGAAGTPQVAYLWQDPPEAGAKDVGWVVKLAECELNNCAPPPCETQCLAQPTVHLTDVHRFRAAAKASPLVDLALGRDGHPMLAMLVGPSDLAAGSLLYLKCADPRCARVQAQDLTAIVGPNYVAGVVSPSDLRLQLGGDLLPVIALDGPAAAGGEPVRIQVVHLANEFGVSGLWRKG